MRKMVTIIMITLIVASSGIALAGTVDYCRAELHTFSSIDELKGYLQIQNEDTWPHYGMYYSGPGMKPESINSMGSTDFSGTNVQVEGVDEADSVKTDGEYIYVISGQQVVVMKAYPAEQAAVLSRISFNGTLKQIFINADRLIVFYTNGSWSDAKTLASIYDIADRSSPERVAHLAVDGDYFAARMIGDYVYLIVRKGMRLVEDHVTLPRIECNSESTEIDPRQIYYSDATSTSYILTMILSLNVQGDAHDFSYSAVLAGWATETYVSTDNTYIVIPRGQDTILHRIRMENGEVTYEASGKVPGCVLNQFSMDEHDGYFRIATTSIEDGISSMPWMSKKENNLYVTDMNLKIVGRLENMAEGESIHSVRFMGNTTYVVTFRKVDPLFVISLSNPRRPEILGELKITGYSDYMHPYDDTHMLGVGKETLADESDTFSWYQGVKISFFDVTDASRPIELAKFEIGNRGTDSPVLTDHKAFLFSKAKNLLVLPVLVAEINQSEYPNDVPPYAYGEATWQGAYVFSVSLASSGKIEVRGRITHNENGNLNCSRYIERALYIDDVLYTVSQSMIKMNSLADLSEIGSLSLN